MKVLDLWNFTAYHSIMFAVVLIGGAGLIFQVSSGEEYLANNPIPVKVTESKFDLNTYPFDTRFRISETSSFIQNHVAY